MRKFGELKKRREELSITVRCTYTGGKGKKCMQSPSFATSITTIARTSFFSSSFSPEESSEDADQILQPQEEELHRPVRRRGFSSSALLFFFSAFLQDSFLPTAWRHSGWTIVSQVSFTFSLLFQCRVGPCCRMLSSRVFISVENLATGVRERRFLSFSC